MRLIDLDCFVIKAIVDELNTRFSSGIIKKIGQTDINKTWLQVKGKRDDWIVIRTGVASPGLYCSSQPPNKKFIKSPFNLFLSNSLSGGEIADVRVKEFDRIVRFRILQRKAGYTLHMLDLIVELTNRNSCLILAEADNNKILVCSKIYQNKGRYIAPGQIYQTIPYPSTKLNPFKIDEAEWRDFITNWPPEKDFNLYLRENLFGLDKELVEEIPFRAGLPDIKSYKGSLPVERLWDSLQDIVKKYGSPASCPTVIIPFNNKMPPVLASFTIKAKSGCGEIRSFTTMNEAAEAFYKLSDEIWAFERLRENLGRIIKGGREKYKKRLLNIQNDLKMLKGDERAKDYGDIIMAHLNLIQKGKDRITLPDLFYGGEISIKLDPAKDPVFNAQEYYKRFGKFKRGLALVQKRKGETELIIKKLEDLDRLLNLTKNLDALKTIEKTLISTTGKDLNERALHLGSFRTRIKRNNKSRKASAGVRIFKINDKWTVMVGKTDQANDYLIKNLARHEDFWLHVHDAPGSHVILKNPKRLESLSFEILKKAASAAAFFSRQRNEDKVLVSYTKKKFVHKPKGMKPGKVLVEKEKTLSVKPSIEGLIPLS